MNDIQERLAVCFANVFPDIPKSEISRASAASLPAWDSVAQVTLLSSVSEEFGLHFEIEDFEQLVSYGMILDYIDSYSKTNSP